MNILDRIGTIIRSNINDLLTRAEDPEKIINQTLIDMRQAQYEARMEVARTIADLAGSRARQGPLHARHGSADRTHHLECAPVRPLQ